MNQVLSPSQQDTAAGPGEEAPQTTPPDMPMPPETRCDLSGVYVVIPAFKEAESLPAVLKELRGYLPTQQIVVVDDGSPDDTSAAAKQAGVNLVRHVINRGQGAAIQTGIDAALSLGAEIVVTFDADGQHRPEDIARLVAPIKAGTCEAVLGSRFLEQTSDIPPVRRAILKLAVLFTRVVSQIRVSDTHNGFRALSAAACQRFRIRQDGMAHASEILDEISRCGIPYQEAPVTIRYTDYSMQKGQRNRDAIKLALRVLLFKVMR